MNSGGVFRENPLRKVTKNNLHTYFLGENINLGQYTYTVMQYGQVYGIWSAKPVKINSDSRTVYESLRIRKEVVGDAEGKLAFVSQSRYIYIVVGYGDNCE